MKNLLGMLAMAGSTYAIGHPGHGLDDPHWHATDVVGLVLAFAVGAGAVWWSRRK